jgi:hypothetical protein
MTCSKRLNAKTIIEVQFKSAAGFCITFGALRPAGKIPIQPSYTALD